MLANEEFPCASAMALFMSTGIALHFVSTLDTLGIKWFIYMTNQGI
mgnify:CR=1 FL=1